MCRLPVWPVGSNRVCLAHFASGVLAYKVVRVDLVRKPVQVAEEDRRHELQPGPSSARRAKQARQGWASGAHSPPWLQSVTSRCSCCPSPLAFSHSFSLGSPSQGSPRLAHYRLLEEGGPSKEERFFTVAEVESGCAPPLVLTGNLCKLESRRHSHGGQGRDLGVL